MAYFVIACIGTSLTTGPYSGQWTLDLNARLRVGTDKRIVVLDLGMPAQTSAWGLANIAPVYQARPDVALIEFGMNDALDTMNISVAQSQSNHIAMIQAIKSNSPRTKVYLQTMNPTYNRVDRPNLTAYNAMYADLVMSQGVDLINHYPNWFPQQASDYDAGGIHPTRPAALRVIIPTLVGRIAPLIG